MSYLLKKELITTGKILYEKGWVDTHSGNISCKANNDSFFISRSGARLGYLAVDDIVKVEKGKPYPPLASSETPVHGAIYAKTTWEAVIHAHLHYTVVWSFLHEKLVPLDSEGLFINGEVDILDCGIVTVGSKLVASKVSEYLVNKNIVIVKGHGVFCADENLDKCLMRVAALENSAQILYDLSILKRRG